jgi:hypothetical protein
MKENNRLLAQREFLAEEELIPGITRLIGYNFVAHWGGGLYEMVHGEKNYKRIFQTQNPHLDRILTEEIQNESDKETKIRNSPNLQRLLYTAYRLMHKYGGKNEEMLR